MVENDVTESWVFPFTNKESFNAKQWTKFYEIRKTKQSRCLHNYEKPNYELPQDFKSLKSSK